MRPGAWSVAFVGVMLQLFMAGCPGDRDATGGPYVEIDPDTEIDFGEVDRGTVPEQVLTIQNVGPRLWEMEINEETVVNFVEFYCLDGEDEECLTVDRFEERQWMLAVHIHCGDGGETSFRLFFNDPESAGSNVEVMDDITIKVTWSTIGDDGEPCS